MVGQVDKQMHRPDLPRNSKSAYTATQYTQAEMLMRGFGEKRSARRDGSNARKAAF